MQKRLMVFAFLLISMWATPVRAEQRLIVRVAGGLPILQNVCRLVGCQILRGLEDPLSQLFVVTISDAINLNGLITTLLNPTGILNIELDLPVRLTQSGTSVPTGLLDRAPVNFFGDIVWNGYAHQPASDIVRVHDAHRQFGVQGRGTVAVIDTGIDPYHPALRSVVVPGYDFTRDASGAGWETAGVNQSTVALVDNGSPTLVSSNTIAVLNQSTVALVDQPGNEAFGHGTIVSGIVHLVAPRAMIMPLRAFRSDGSGYLSDILRAIYFASRSDAKVINMSFSLPTNSRELARAVDFATNKQIVCVASAGNSGRMTMVYPAGLPNAMGVASTDLFDRRSSFSNYGEQLVWVGAPGENIISTYPFGTYASATGTSFSAPFVAGTAALLLDLSLQVDYTLSSMAIAKAKPIDQNLGNGRLDIYRALEWLRTTR